MTGCNSNHANADPCLFIREVERNIPQSLVMIFIDDEGLKLLKKSSRL
jgi:hypothetical protein